MASFRLENHGIYVKTKSFFLSPSNSLCPCVCVNFTVKAILFTGGFGLRFAPKCRNQRKQRGKRWDWSVSELVNVRPAASVFTFTSLLLHSSFTLCFESTYVVGKYYGKINYATIYHCQIRMSYYGLMTFALSGLIAISS